jgi:hypothetical protein
MTGIGVAGVTVVTFFKALVTSFEINAGDGIAAARANALGRTSVGAYLIAIVTGLVAIVAGYEIRSLNRVAATRRYTGGTTGVITFLVAVVASLITFIALGDISALDAVAATGAATIVAASIGVIRVGIVTLLDAVDHTITAAFSLTSCATTVTRHHVAVVTTFMTRLTWLAVGAHDAVAASCYQAVIATRVGVCGVAIIADLFAAL